MMMGAIAANRRRTAAFNPLTLSPTAWYDPSDMSSMFQDSAGTTPAAVDSPVGKLNDKSGNGNHAVQATSAARPMLRSSGGLYWLEFDGVDDALVATVSFGGAFDRISGLAVQIGGATRTLSNQSGSGLLRWSGDMALYNGSGLVVTPLANGVTAVITERHNGASSRIATDASAYVTGDPGSQAATALEIGGWVGGGQYGQCNLFGLFLRDGVTLTDPEITSLRTYIAAKAGVTL